MVTWRGGVSRRVAIDEESIPRLDTRIPYSDLGNRSAKIDQAVVAILKGIKNEIQNRSGPR